jgi:hypothetical protein
VQLGPRLLAAVAALAVGAAVGPAPVGAETADPALTYEAWYARAKQAPPQVAVPGQGPVSPGDTNTTPNVPDGAYAVSSAGGQPGDEGTSGDVGWAAFQWNVADAGIIETFQVAFTQAPNARDAGTPSIQACNIVEDWAAAPASNPWDVRPVEDCSAPIVPTVEGKTYTFDLTPLATTWAAGEGYGVVLVPAAPEGGGNVAPFQLSLAGYGHPDEAARPKVTFEFTPLAAADFGGELGGELAGGAADSSFATPSVGSSDSGLLAPAPGLDIDPNDIGSPPLEVAGAPPAIDGGTAAAPVVAGSPAAATGSGFPLAGWLLLPFALGVAALTGTALGPAGDPTVPREGGVSRVLAARRAARLETARS